MSIVTYIKQLFSKGSIPQEPEIKPIYSDLNMIKNFIKESDEVFMVHACRTGNIPIIEYLYSIGIKASHYAAIKAIQHGQLDVCRYLHTKGYEFNYNTLVDAARYGHLEIFRYLNNIGVKSGRTNPMYIAIKNGDLIVIKYFYIIKYKYADYAMDYAIKNNHLDVVDYLQTIHLD